MVDCNDAQNENENDMVPTPLEIIIVYGGEIERTSCYGAKEIPTCYLHVYHRHLMKNMTNTTRQHNRLPALRSKNDKSFTAMIVTRKKEPTLLAEGCTYRIYTDKGQILHQVFQRN